MTEPSAPAGDRRASLLTQLSAAQGRPLAVRELLHRAGLHQGERTVVKRELRELVRDGTVVKDGKRYALPSAEPAPQRSASRVSPTAGRRRVASAAVRGVAGGGQRTRAGPPRPAALSPQREGRRAERSGGVLGTFTRHRDGYGFVARLDREGDDLFIPPDEASKAMEGDLVRVAIVPAPRGRTMGVIEDVVERRRRWALGTYHDRGSSSFVVPEGELGGAISVAPTKLAEDGELVKVALARGGEALSGEVVERVGRPGDPRVEVLKVAYAKGFSDLFPEDVVAEAAQVPDAVHPADRAGRRDLTALPLVTIDGEDARDFDDAVHVERVPGKGPAKWRAVVAIADVAHYVRDGSALDAEALRRGTSVYFPAQVLPMLPERLSNGICSLNPDVDRLCMVADVRFDDAGQAVGVELYEGVMRSAARCTYTEVARVLDGESVPGRERFEAAFERMAALQERLTAMRARRGAIDFDIPEAKIVLDEEGRVTGLERRPRNRAHRIVEELMLAANEAVARHLGQADLPAIYRVHDLPDEEKLEAFRKLARTHGFEVPDGPLGPKQLNALLHAIGGHAQQRALNQLLLRAMMQAVYQTENIGHYGLAAEHYLHFTSPIRRYPDLMVHRLLKGGWRVEGVAPPPRPQLERIASLCSERERASMHAEREIASFYAALFLEDKIGERHPGVVATVVEFGLFVEVEPWLVEGLVKAEDLGDGFELDPDLHALVQRRTGRAFRVGDRVEVLIEAASPARRQVDLRLVEDGEVVEGEPHPRARRSKGGERRPERGPKPRAEARPRAQKAGPASKRGGGRREAKKAEAKKALPKGQGGPPRRRGR